jgi:hypothetical protein
LWVVQIMAHSARTFSTPRNRNWRKPRACLILSEHRFHHLLSQSVRRFEAAVVDLFAHQLRQRSTNFSDLPLSGAGRVQVRHSRRYHVLRAL